MNRIGMVLCGLLVGGCVEDLPGPGFVDEFPALVGLRADVVVPTSLIEIAPLPPGRLRAELLPGDTVQLDALFVTDAGPIDLDETQAQWLLCQVGCTGRLYVHPNDVPTCDADGDTLADALYCRAGVGARVSASIPVVIRELNGSDVVVPWANEIMVITGQPGGPTTEQCVDGLMYGSGDDLHRCGIATQLVAAGPVWALEALSKSPFDGDEPLTIPPELRLPAMLPPNSAPLIERVWVLAGADAEYELRSVDDEIELPINEVVAIAPYIHPHDRQYTIFPSGTPHAWLGVWETISQALLYDHPEVVRRYGWPPMWAKDNAVALRTPSEPSEANLYLRAIDSRRGVTWYQLSVRFVGE